MENILISFIGTGTINKQVGKRTYKNASYKFDQTTYINKSYFGFAVKEYYDINSTILIGTPKSMWEHIYETLCLENGVEVDKEIYYTLMDYTETANYNTPVEHLPHKEVIEKLLGHGSQIIILKYGLNEEDIQYNMERILDIESCLPQHAQVIMDVTHSFRSLPLFLMNTINFIQNVSSKQIQISHLLYGMLEVSSEMHDDNGNPYAPVVDLKSTLTVQDWITGAHSFKEYGNAYKIVSLIDKEDASLANVLKRLSDTKNINYLSELKAQVQKVRTTLDKEMSTIPNKVVKPVLQEFVRSFPDPLMSSAQFQMSLARWHYKKKNYSSAYIVFVEAMLSFACECADQNPECRTSRNKCKKNFHKMKGTCPLENIYKDSRDIRNQIAHNIEGKSEITQMICELESNLTFVEQYFNKCYNGAELKKEYKQRVPTNTRK